MTYLWRFLNQLKYVFTFQGVKETSFPFVEHLALTI